MNKFLQVLILLFLFSVNVFSQCTNTVTGVQTNVSCFGLSDGAINITVNSTGGTNPTYCLPTYNNPCGNCPTTWDQINNFSTTGGSTNISNLNSNCNGNLPNNYSYVNQTVTVNPGGSFNFQVQCAAAGTGCGSTFNQGFRIWVDWNNDGDFFDAGENMWNSGSAGFQVFSGTITVPASAACGKRRMRVRCTYAAVPNDPCNLQLYGEVEDYNLQVGSTNTYLWSNGATTEDISNLPAGDYSVTVTGGSDSDTLSFTITQPPALPAAIIANGPLTFCDGENVILDAGASGLFYTWSSGETTQTISANVNGVYGVTISATIGGCGTTDTINVNVIPAPTPAIITPADTILLCPNSSILLTSDITTGIEWTPNGETSQSITVNAAGNYSVITTNASGCTSESAIVTVQSVPPPSPSISAGGPTSFCIGESVILTSNYPSGNSWSTGATSNSITVTASGTYFLTVTGVGGCSGVSSGINVTVNPLPTPTITPNGPTTFCQGGSVTLSSNYLTGNSWSNGTSNSTVLATTTSTYSITVTDANGCSAIGGPTNIVVNPLPAAAIITPNGPTTFCSGNSLSLSSSYPSGNIWSTGSINNSITVTQTGTYSVTYTDINGCASAATSIDITVNTTPTATFNAPASFCFVDNATITYTGNAPASAQYTWDFGGATIVSGSGQGPYFINYSALGSYTITLQVSNNGCTSILQSQNITVNPNPTSTFTLSDNDICLGESIIATYNGNAPTNSTFNWAYGNGNLISGSGASPINVQYNLVGASSIALTVTQGTCISTQTQLPLTVNELPSAVITAPITQACDSLGVTFNSANPASSYLWNLGNGQTSGIQNPGTYYTVGSYNVSLSVTDANGCQDSVMNTAFINVIPTPLASFSMNPRVIDSIDLDLANITFNNTSSYAAAAIWDFGDGSTSIVYSPSHSYSLPGDYSVQLIAINELGCSDTAYKGPFRINPAAITYIPNTFSPNGDGINDIFYIYCSRIKDMRLIIYDRLGTQLFESTDINSGWDGTFKSSAMNTGVYVYYCKVYYDNGKIEELFGDINLIR